MPSTVINRSEFAVYVPDGKGGSVAVLPGQPFPKGAKVTNPLVLGKAAASAPAKPDTDSSAGEYSGGGQGEAPEPPPQSGKGSGEDEWRDYAEQLGADVTDLETRADIINHLESEGHPV